MASTTTSAQRRDLAKAEFDTFMASCPSRQLLERIGDKWCALILAALYEQPSRYSELSRKVAGVSQKMLTQTLRAMERDGLATRTVTPTVPVRVDYELTALGESLHQVVLQLKEWAESNMSQIQTNRARFDQLS